MARRPAWENTISIGCQIWGNILALATFCAGIAGLVISMEAEDIPYLGPPKQTGEKFIPATSAPNPIRRIDREKTAFPLGAVGPSRRGPLTRLNGEGTPIRVTRNFADALSSSSHLVHSFKERTMTPIITNEKPTSEETVASAVSSAIAEAAVEHMGRIERQIETVLEPGESHLYWHKASKSLAFIVRVIPLVPDLLTRPKKYLLVLCPSRLLIVRMTNPLNKLKDSEVKRLEATIPWSNVKSILPRRRLTSSSVVVRTKSFGTHHFKYLQSDAADELASQAKRLIDASNRAL